MPLVNRPRVGLGESVNVAAVMGMACGVEVTVEWHGVIDIAMTIGDPVYFTRGRICRKRPLKVPVGSSIRVATAKDGGSICGQ